jgi:hypothetical protein
MSLRNHSKLENSILARLEASPSDYLPEVSATLLRHFLRAYFSRLRSNGLDDPGRTLIFNFTDWIQQKYGVDRSYHGSAEIIDSYSSGSEDAFRNFLSELTEFAQQPEAFEPSMVDKTKEKLSAPRDQGFAELIQDLRTRPALYLGFSTFRGLAAYLQGHIVAADEHNLPRDPQETAFSGFKRWVEERKNKGTPRNWYRLVLYMSTTDCDHVDSGAVRTFFAWYDEYTKHG